MTRRVVRFTESFFASLDGQLPGERPGDGTPSVTDFLAFDVPTIRDRLAEDVEGSTKTIPPDTRFALTSAPGSSSPTSSPTW